MSGMEIDDKNGDYKRCFKIKDCLDSFNIVYNESNSMFMFCNKYQIFAYEFPNFETPARVFVPDFQLRELIISNNYLLCLDTADNVHIISLKFKSCAQKTVRCNFQPKQKGVLICRQLTTDAVLCLKYVAETYYLSLHRINAEFQLKKRVELSHDEKHWPLPRATQEKHILYSHALGKEDIESIKQLFKINYMLGNDNCIILIAFDRITVYGCLFSSNIPDDDITLLKLYASPSEISDIQIIVTDNINLIVGLSIGTIVKLPLNNMPQTPVVVHLNTAIFKFLTSKTTDTIFYTDGSTMWKVENALSKEETNFTQVFPRHVKDFIKFGDQLICTTFTKLIYMFPSEDETMYLKPVSTGDYCNAEELLNNSECYYKIMKELEKNDDLSKKISQEGSYITALALSKRQDVMDKVIKQSVDMYNDYEEAVKENPEVTLTEEISKYFKSQTFFFLIKLTSTIIHHTFNDVLSNLFGDLKIHISILSGQKLLKTTSIKLNEALKKVKVLIPLCNTNMLNVTEMKINIKIVTNIPGSLNEKQAIWITLYRKVVVLNSVHFIKTNMVSNKVASYKEPQLTTEDLILQSASNHHGELFKFTDISMNTTNAHKLSLFIKLPNNYKELLKTENYYKEYLNSKKVEYFQKHLSSEEFLKSKTNLCFEIANDEVKIKIVSYFSRPLMKITSSNLKIAFNVRNFLADLVYKNVQNTPDSGIQFVNYSLYTTIENLQKEIKNCILNRPEDLLPLLKQFHKTVYGSIPL